MSEIKIGEYVRTHKGIIAKVQAYQELKIYGEDNKSAIFNSFETDKGTIADVEISKHSENIIDLIEKEDIVNGMTVEEFDDDETGELYLGFPIYNDAIMDCIEEVCPLVSLEKITSILTHEQYEQNCYRLEN